MSESDQFWLQKYQKMEQQGGLTVSERHEIRERYLAEQMKTNNLKLNKNKVISKEDPLNMPRHKVHGVCPDFKECPLCYKCRNYDSSHETCRNCILTQEKLHCKTHLHTERVLSMMITRERIDADGINFRLYYTKLEDGRGFIAKYILPGGSVVLFNPDEDKIDFEPMRPYIGHQFEYFIDGESQGVRVFKGFTDVEGVKAINIGEIYGKEE